MAERKSGPVKPPVIDLKARDASQPAETGKPAAKPAAPKPAAAKVESAAAKPEPIVETRPEAATVTETVTERVIETPAEPRPEPVRPIPTPPTPPVRQARLAMPWSAIGIAAAGGAILGTVLTYLLVNVLPLPSNAPVIADPAEQLSALDGRIATLEQRVPTLEESARDTQVSLDATIAQLDSGIAGVKTSITALETRLNEVQASIPAATTPVDLAPLTEQLDTLQSRVTAIAAGASSADAAALADSLNTIEASIAALTTRLDQNDARFGEIDAIRAELDTAKAAIAAQTRQLGGADIGPAVKLPLLVSGLETAFAAGRPYTAELASLRALLPNLAVPEPVVATAETGLQRPDALAADFRAAVPAILAGRTALSTGDWGKDAIEWAKALLALRPSGEIEGNSPEAIVSRLEAAVERSDFAAAAALLDRLPDAMQSAAGDVATAIRSHASADGFIAGLRAQALAPATEATPLIRLTWWIVISLLVTAAVAWLISLPGTLTLEFLGLRMQPRLGVAAFFVMAAIAVIIFVWGLIRRIVGAPYYIARRSRERRKDLAFAALSDGFIALQAGDASKARLLAREARANLPQNAAAQLLEARADLALGDMHSAREHYRALITNKKTALAALSGLYDQARAQGRTDAALTFAQKATEISPYTSWANEAVFDDLTRKGLWTDAANMIATEPAVTRDEKMRKRRRQAVVETARAQLAEATDQPAALDHALAALKLVPDFVPAALIAARIYINRGDSRKAMSLLRRVWRATSHPDVATLFANAVPGTSAVDRLKRVRELVDTPPQNKPAALVLARACIDAYDWPAARNALANYSSANPSQSICLMMAEIEEGQSGDQGKAREWVNRAVRAPRDPVWTADGITAEDWEPVSPVTGKLDAFEWRVPTSAVATRVTEAAAAPPKPAPDAPLALPDA